MKDAPISHISTPIHTRCTTPAPCPSHPLRLPSNDALLLTSKPRRNPTNFAPFRENPQQKPPFFAPPGHLPPVKYGYSHSQHNMLCFILDTPYRGRYFHDCTTPRHIRFTVKETFGSPLVFIAPLPPTPSPPGSTTQPPQRRSRLKNRALDSPNDVSQKL
jgi:hypothetical protein